MLVSDVMTVDVVTVPTEATLRDAVGHMLKHDIGCVITVNDGDPTGILTQSDVLQAAYERDEPLASISVATAMSHPLETIAPGATVRAAARRMREVGVKRLAVTDGIDLVGILTQSDVVRNHSLLLKEAVHHEERRQRLERDDDGV